MDANEQSRTMAFDWAYSLMSEQTESGPLGEFLCSTGDCNVEKNSENKDLIKIKQKSQRSTEKRRKKND